ncbi:MAG: hypoxanthine phosphoribosyltransferase [Bdellovibrionales bacterium RBG_16_40_8]|nr:MAG: hypoxanthine phosphoribosyltransferase [Bdellovibrionales bacterium RBG_16_40_8]
MDKLRLKTILTEKAIQKRIAEMGATLTDKLKGKQVVAICILKGSFVFFSDLIRSIECDMVCEFMGLSSYQNQSSSSGEVKLTLDLNSTIEGKHVLLVEDIIDTGITMNYLQKILEPRKPAGVITATLLHKPDAKKVDCHIDLVGFKIPNEFVVGYGMDYQNRYRHLPYIAQVENLN